MSSEVGAPGHDGGEGGVQPAQESGPKQQLDTALPTTFAYTLLPFSCSNSYT